MNLKMLHLAKHGLVKKEDLIDFKNGLNKAEKGFKLSNKEKDLLIETLLDMNDKVVNNNNSFQFLKKAYKENK